MYLDIYSLTCIFNDLQQLINKNVALGFESRVRDWCCNILNYRSLILKRGESLHDGSAGHGEGASRAKAKMPRLDRMSDGPRVH